MNYVRTFILQACHFNGEREYELYRSAFSLETTSIELVRTMLYQCLAGSHGHNFEVTVDLFGALDGSTWLVDDAVLTPLVMAWDNCNLSVHPDFYDMRATTENMADQLAYKIRQAFPALKAVVVRVRETRDIYAEVKLLCR